MSISKILVLFLLSPLIVIACAPASLSSPTSTTDLILAISTNPSPPKIGEVEINITLQDAQGRALEGAEVTVTAEHTDMSGMEMEGKATEQGQGRYAIRAHFSMSGNWTLRVQVRKNTLSYQRDFPLNILP
ncbi:FixH family protein [uncultured Thermanaerothrix sp.]|uniref:FixH family protein n=1 Tax=uncultured Thermanaerothrix sp. TaxID=1195149 RepID=UPI0026281B79|nr:FixH family protein [uncultured Thermanaerothrix sp.]